MRTEPFVKYFLEIFVFKIALYVSFLTVFQAAGHNFRLTAESIKCIVCIINIHTWQTDCRKGTFMKILISNSSDQPLYLQIKEQLKDAILRADLKDGDSMPSIRRFANDLGVSVLTIRRVYDELEQEGYLNQQVGVGTFVSAANTELLRDAKRHLVELKIQDALQAASALDIPLKELHDMLDILYDDIYKGGKSNG